MSRTLCVLDRSHKPYKVEPGGRFQPPGSFVLYMFLVRLSRLNNPLRRITAVNRILIGCAVCTDSIFVLCSANRFLIGITFEFRDSDQLPLGCSGNPAVHLVSACLVDISKYSCPTRMSVLIRKASQVSPLCSLPWTDSSRTRYLLRFSWLSPDNSIEFPPTHKHHRNTVRPNPVK